MNFACTCGSTEWESRRVISFEDTAMRTLASGVEPPSTANRTVLLCHRCGRTQNVHGPNLGYSLTAS